jgi:hypothetical protein
MAKSEHINQRLIGIKFKSLTYHANINKSRCCVVTTGMNHLNGNLFLVTSSLLLSNRNSTSTIMLSIKLFSYYLIYALYVWYTLQKEVNFFHSQIQEHLLRNLCSILILHKLVIHIPITLAFICGRKGFF